MTVGSGRRFSRLLNVYRFEVCQDSQGRWLLQTIPGFPALEAFLRRDLSEYLWSHQPRVLHDPATHLRVNSGDSVLDLLPFEVMLALLKLPY